MARGKTTTRRLLETAVVLLAAMAINSVEVKTGKHRGSELVLFTPRMQRARRRILKAAAGRLPTRRASRGQRNASR